MKRPKLTRRSAYRAIVDIFKLDEGTVYVMGQPPDKTRERIGYLPEERGLYRDLRVFDVLAYLAELKGAPRSIARQRALTWKALREA